MTHTRLLHPLVAGLLLALTTVCHAQSADLQPIPPLKGSVVLSGGGTLPIGVMRAFARLAGGNAARIVVVSGAPTDSGGEADPRWKRLEVASIETLRVRRAEDLQSPDALVRLLGATGIWLAAELQALDGNPLFERVLQGVVARGGVAGGHGPGARQLARFTRDGAPAGFDVLPRSVVVVDHDEQRDSARLVDALAANPGCVGWAIPREAALVVHHGRQVGAIGSGTVAVKVAGCGDWDERVTRLEAAEFVQRWDELPYQLDLIAWTRSAQIRLQPAFPGDKPAPPVLANGTLVLSGGRRVTEDTWARFIKAAGGADATIVCIPTGSDQEDEDKDSFSAGELAERGCTNLQVLHTHQRSKADDEEFTHYLKTATGVWIDGGRTYRLMDAYQHTRVHRLMRAVLERGGVLGGSSAGAQVMGDFLMRGNPRGNATLWWDGYQTGFAFLTGVIIDAHFRQRDRQHTFPAVVADFPQMLGIGVDENTALVVTGNVGEVLGENAVTFFDFRDGHRRDVVLRAGKTYDLQERKPLDN